MIITGVKLLPIIPVSAVIIKSGHMFSVKVLSEDFQLPCSHTDKRL